MQTLTSVIVRVGRWTKLTLDDLNATYAQQVAFEAALQGLVLLKNDANTLPLKTGVNLAVIGPMATDPTLYLSDYVAAGVYVALHLRLHLLVVAVCVYTFGRKLHLL